jgi:hypothetical protein
MTAEQEGAIISDGFLTALVRAATWNTARPELMRQLKSYVTELETDKPDAFDRMCIDLCRVWMIHLKAMGSAPNTTSLPETENVMEDLEAYAILQRKVAHRCIDASCPLCDVEYDPGKDQFHPTQEALR